jgi:hypothetical protein
MSEIRPLLEQLYIHVAAMPWKDTGFVRSEVAQKAAQDQIINHILREIEEINEKATKRETASE